MKKLSEASIPTEYGTFIVLAFGDNEDEYSPHLALVSENIDKENPILLRIHSECLTGDIFGSRRCECGEQLHTSLEQIGKEGGVLIYLRQEGRGIGLINKLKAYQLQDKGLDTVEANIHLGFDPDERHYDIAIEILELLDIKSIILLTNNPDKLQSIKDSTIHLEGRRPLIIPPRATNKDYLDTKEEFFGHLFKHQ
ncbi:GTP cyclohydrolase II [Membranihabitans maritimus]|uniref:GTP cyclohydrolase II n=1 Tax=Membranihabitans maritimus TaxID=2904244 RepID=UPI001EFFE0C4|nr:GTP cyclohydrolase II [Membranihabitans maritimus]